MSKLAHFLDTASKFALFSVSGLKYEQFIKKKQNYTKTETRKLYSRLPNVIKIDPYKFELYRFKVIAFFETVFSCSYPSHTEAATKYPCCDRTETALRPSFRGTHARTHTL